MNDKKKEGKLFNEIIKALEEARQDNISIIEQWQEFIEKARELSAWVKEYEIKTDPKDKMSFEVHVCKRLFTVSLALEKEHGLVMYKESGREAIKKLIIDTNGDIGDCKGHRINGEFLTACDKPKLVDYKTFYHAKALRDIIKPPKKNPQISFI